MGRLVGGVGEHGVGLPERGGREHGVERPEAARGERGVIHKSIDA